LIFIDVDMVGRRNAVNPKVKRHAIDPELREDIMAQISIELILLRKMAGVVHEGLPFATASLVMQLCLPVRTQTIYFFPALVAGKRSRFARSTETHRLLRRELDIEVKD
jgi:hypothetical protein